MASESVQPDPAPVDLETNDTIEDNNAPAGGSSDGEGGERTAREKLKKTSIAGLAQFSKSTTGGMTGDHPLSESVTTDALPEQSTSENGGPRGRPSKKRSFEDLQQDEHTGPIANGSATLPDPKRNQHKRMRSRDIPGGQVREIGKFEDAGSPVREESDDERPGGAGVLVDPQTEVDTNAQRRLGEKILEEEDATNEPTIGVGGPEAVPSVAVHAPQQAQSGNEEHDPRQNSALEPSSGFANVSPMSPFGAVRSPPPTSTAPSTITNLPTATSSSAFASSGLSAFASSDKSPFGASSTSKSTGGFGGGGLGFGNTTSSGFGGAQPSGFGSTPSAFGSTSSFGNKSTSGFGSTSDFGSTGGFGLGAAPRPFGGAVSSFATAGGAGTFGKAKSFGAKSYEADEGSVKEDEERHHDDDDSKPDNRFSEQRGMSALSRRWD
jgi:Ran-binding protein 3